jgi:RNA polymerase sigma factor (sigma-70 family)
MSEEDFARRYYPLLRAIAGRLRQKGDEYQDLTQIGIIAALKLYREAGELPNKALVVCAARRAMLHEIRRGDCSKRDRKLTDALTPVLEDMDLTSDPRPERKLVCSIDLGRAVAGAKPHEREVLRRTLEGETLAEIAERHRVKPSRVAYLKASAIRGLQLRLAA